MSGPFAFIVVKTTADPVIPARGLSPAEFQRKTSGYTKAIAGGVLEAGTIDFHALEKARANRLLCDGSLYAPTQFPDLFSMIGNTFGGDGVTTFAVPNYSGALEIPAPTVTTTVDPSGTVSTGEPVTDAGAVGGTTGGNVPSGGRVRQLARPDEEFQ